MKDYGSVVKSLMAFMVPIRKKVHREHFSTPRYYIELHRAIHRGFEQWCTDNDVSLSCMNKVRLDIIQHIHDYQLPGRVFDLARILRDTLPDEFNVRGQWTPVRKVVKW